MEIVQKGVLAVEYICTACGEDCLGSYRVYHEALYHPKCLPKIPGRKKARSRDPLVQAYMDRDGMREGDAMKVAAAVRGILSDVDIRKR